MGMVFRATANEVDGFSARSTVLYVLAAIEEAALVLLGPNIIQFGHESFARAVFFCLGDIDKKRLVGRACKGTEDVDEVVSAGGAGCDNSLR